MFKVPLAVYFFNSQDGIKAIEPLEPANEEFFSVMGVEAGYAALNLHQTSGGPSCH